MENSISAEPIFTTDETEPGRLAAIYVKHLEEYPHDSAVREKLAVLYARHFKRLDLATLEFEQLLNEPGHSPKQIARWLRLLAKMQVELNAPAATVEWTLRQIVERFPDQPESEVARQSLAQIQLQDEGRSSESIRRSQVEG